MATLSYLTIGIPASNRLVFRNIHDQVIPVVVPTTGIAPGGVHKGGGKRRIRVRRADFTSQENYEFALRAALADAQFAIRHEEAIVPVKAKSVPIVTDTEIKVSVQDLAALQQASDLDEMALLELFITVIESNY